MATHERKAHSLKISAIVFNCCFKILTEILIKYLSGLLDLTILGVLIHQFFYIYHIIYVVWRPFTLLSVLKAIWYPRYTTGLTIGLMLIITYILVGILSLHYSKDYPNSVCYSLWMCLVISYGQTFKVRGGFWGNLASAYTTKF